METLDPKLSYESKEHAESAQYILQIGENDPTNFDQVIK